MKAIPATVTDLKRPCRHRQGGRDTGPHTSPCRQDCRRGSHPGQQVASLKVRHEASKRPRNSIRNPPQGTGKHIPGRHTQGDSPEPKAGKKDPARLSLRSLVQPPSHRGLCVHSQEAAALSYHRKQGLSCLGGGTERGGAPGTAPRAESPSCTVQRGLPPTAVPDSKCVFVFCSWQLLLFLKNKRRPAVHPLGKDGSSGATQGGKEAQTLGWEGPCPSLLTAPPRATKGGWMQTHRQGPADSGHGWTREVGVGVGEGRDTPRRRS